MKDEVGNYLILKGISDQYTQTEIVDDLVKCLLSNVCERRGEVAIPQRFCGLPKSDFTFNGNVKTINLRKIDNVIGKRIGIIIQNTEFALIDNSNEGKGKIYKNSVKN